MTVSELIEMLEDCDPDMEVRIAEQPWYPFEYYIEGVAEYEGKIFICEGNQLAYASSEIWDCIW